jgi:hypothetical protein
VWFLFCTKRPNFSSGWTAIDTCLTENQHTDLVYFSPRSVFLSSVQKGLTFSSAHICLATENQHAKTWFLFPALQNLCGTVLYSKIYDFMKFCRKYGL